MLATDETLLKGGHSAKDAYYRAGSAGRPAALPEEPILLRIYAVEESAAREWEFHSWLRDAGHLGGHPSSRFGVVRDLHQVPGPGRQDDGTLGAGVINDCEPGED